MAFETLDNYDTVALIDEQGRKFSYEELVGDADGIAANIGYRCLVFLMCRNCVESVAGYIGFLRNEIVPVLVRENMSDEFLIELLEHYHPAYFYLPANRTSPLNGTVIYQYADYALVKLGYTKDYTLAPELALLLTTSGSTGSPKLVRQSYRNIYSNTRSIVEYLKIVDSDRAITNLPMDYTYGLSILNTHLHVGASVILTEASMMEARFWELLKKQCATTFGGVPYTYDILKKLRFGQMDLPSLRYITQAGGKLSKETAEEFNAICKKNKLQLIVMYGQTEATARMSWLPWEYAEEKAGSIGIAIPGGRFWLEDVAGNVIEEPELVGELVYGGENVTLGYAQSRFDLTRGDDNRGVLHTGDMAHRDKDGFYYITGRKKRFLKIFGSRINLDEIEALLHRKGCECVCIGKDDGLLVYITRPEQLDLVSNFLGRDIRINRLGFKIHVIEKIPRNSSGKVLYSALTDAENG